MSPSPLEKGAGGILFHTVAWLHPFAPFAYFVVPFSLKAFSLQSIYLSSYPESILVAPFIDANTTDATPAPTLRQGGGSARHAAVFMKPCTQVASPPPASP